MQVFCSSLGGNHILFYKWLCAIWYRWEESSCLLSIQDSMFESYSMMKEQVRKAEEELKIQQKELEKSKKEVTFYSDVLLRSKFGFLLCFLTWLSSFCQALTFLQNGEVSDLQNRNVPLIFEWWMAESLLVGQNIKWSLMQHTVAESECPDKGTHNNLPNLAISGQLLPSTSLAIGRSRRQWRHWGLLQTWIESSFWMRSQIMCSLALSGVCCIQRHCQACCPFSPQLCSKHQVQHHLFGDLCGWVVLCLCEVNLHFWHHLRKPWVLCPFPMH